jgi:hypothetical protein
MSKKLGPMVSMYLLRELFRSFVMKISFSAQIAIQIKAVMKLKMW